MNLRIKVCILALFSLIIGSTISAAPAIQIYVNDQVPETDTTPVLRNGTTLVPLRSIEAIQGLKIKSWDKKTQTIIITDQDQTELSLKVSSKTATKGNETLKLEAPPVLKNGRVLVPIRFIAEAFNSDAAWNTHTKTVYIAKLDSVTKEKLNSKDLPTARSAAVSIPKITTLQDLYSLASDQSGGDLQLFFLEGKSDVFFILGSNIINKYEVRDNAAWNTWSAALKETSNKGEIKIVPNKEIIKEVGTKPVFSSNYVYYNISTHAGTAEYGSINSSGQKKSLGSKDLSSLDKLFPIE